MKRRLFTLAAAFSLVLSIATVVLWVRSYSLASYAEWEHLAKSEAWWWRLHSAGGGISYQYAKEVYYRSGITPDHSNAFKLSEFQDEPSRDEQLFFDRRWGALGFKLFFTSQRTNWFHGSGWELIVPHWFAVICSTVLPLLWIRQTRRRRRERVQGACTNCGYDLRATPDRCPECATVPAKATAA